jgi:hypothetical protein
MDFDSVYIRRYYVQADLRLRPRGHRDRRAVLLPHTFSGL